VPLAVDVNNQGKDVGLASTSSALQKLHGTPFLDTDS
jgi:hypothetical protein